MAREFETSLKVEPLWDGLHWRVLEPFVYECDEWEHIVVPVGYVTDFASIPRFLWWLLPPTGKYTRAAALHDYLYYAHKTEVRGVARVEADRIFAAAMEDSGVCWLARKIVWAGVRLCGSAAWNRRRVYKP